MPKGVRSVHLPDVALSRIGGDVAVDFFNTVDWRFDPSRRNERLPTYPHLLAWMKQSELVPVGEVEVLARQASEQPDLASAEQALVIEMRDDTYDTLNEGGDLGTLQRHLTSAYASSRLDREPGGTWRWAPTGVDLAAPRHLLALEFARLLTSDAIVRLHRCEDRYCGWVFIDTSRQHNRRWCSAADCGNRNRVRAHYERSKTGSPPKVR